MQRLFLYTCILSLLTGCDLFNQKDETVQGKQLARVGNKILLAEQVKVLTENIISKEDSTRLVNEYIENWVRHNLMLAYANENLPANKLDIEKQLQDYRESLIIYTYEKEYVNQQLDTVLTESEIKDFYKKNEDNFQLDQDIYRLLYVKLLEGNTSVDSVKSWMEGNGQEERESLRTFTFKFSVESHLNDSVWLTKRDMNQVVPNCILETIVPGNVGMITEIDSPHVYIFNIIELKNKENTAPLAYVRDDIRKIILNRRKMELLKKLGNNIMNDAKRRNSYEIYK